MKRDLVSFATHGLIGCALGMSYHLSPAQTTSIIVIENETNHIYVALELKLKQDLINELYNLEFILSTINYSIHYDRLWTTLIPQGIVCSSYTYRDILKSIHKSPRDEIP